MNDVARHTNEFKKAYAAFKRMLPDHPSDWSEAHFEKGVAAAIGSYLASKELNRWDLPSKGSGNE